LQLDHLRGIGDLHQNILFHSLCGDERQKTQASKEIKSLKGKCCTLWPSISPALSLELPHLSSLQLYRSASCPGGVNYMKICIMHKTGNYSF
jgi:hypothetical protein